MMQLANLCMENTYQLLCNHLLLQLLLHLQLLCLHLLDLLLLLPVWWLRFLRLSSTSTIAEVAQMGVFV